MLKKISVWCMVFVVCLSITIGSSIQVYETDSNDLTTAATKFKAVVPTQQINSHNGTADIPVMMDNISQNYTRNESKISTDDTEVAANKFNVTTSIRYMPDENQNSAKSARIKSDNENRKPAADQQQRSSASENTVINQKKFIPSPELKIVGSSEAINVESPTAPESFLPTTKYYRSGSLPAHLPSGKHYGSTIHHIHHHLPKPVDDASAWWLAKPVLKDHHKNYQKYGEHQIENEPKQDNTKINWPQYENGKWIWMPNKDNDDHTTTEKPGQWKWVPHDELPKPPNPTIVEPFNYEQVHDFYHYDEKTKFPSTTDTPFSNEGRHYHHGHHGYHHNSFENWTPEPSTQSISESEWTKLLSKEKEKDEKPKQPMMKMSPWKKILHVMTAAIPIGLLISALTPQVIYVDPNSTIPLTTIPSNPFGLLKTKYRSLDGSDSSSAATSSNVSQALHNISAEEAQLADQLNSIIGRKMSNPLMDFLNILNNYGDRSSAFNADSATAHHQCDDRHFCETSRLGLEPNANVINKMLWKIANETPFDQAKKNGLDEIFQAIKNGNCEVFKCQNNDPSSSSSSSDNSNKINYHDAYNDNDEIMITSGRSRGQNSRKI